MASTHKSHNPKHVGDTWQIDKQNKLYVLGVDGKPRCLGSVVKTTHTTKYKMTKTSKPIAAFMLGVTRKNKSGKDETTSYSVTHGNYGKNIIIPGATFDHQTFEHTRQCIKDNNFVPKHIKDMVARQAPTSASKTSKTVSLTTSTNNNGDGFLSTKQVLDMDNAIKRVDTVFGSDVEGAGKSEEEEDTLSKLFGPNHDDIDRLHLPKGKPQQIQKATAPKPNSESTSNPNPVEKKQKSTSSQSKVYLHVYILAHKTLSKK
jgi:hypothetical protein